MVVGGKSPKSYPKAKVDSKHSHFGLRIRLKTPGWDLESDGGVSDLRNCQEIGTLSRNTFKILVTLSLKTDNFVALSLSSKKRGRESEMISFGGKITRERKYKYVFIFKSK